MPKAILTALFLIQFWHPTLAEDSAYGKFVGRIAAEWDSGGRKMKLLEDFQYIGPDKLTWNAPAGSVVDGASIPQIAWSIIGGPFEGKYRDASVIHDIACDERSRPWQSVHEAFYTAMLARGVDVVQAKIMYAAVYHLGPRWPRKIEVDSNTTMEDARKKSAVETRRGEVGKVVTVVRRSYQWNNDGFLGMPSPTYTEEEVPVAVEFDPLTSQVTPSNFQELEKAIKDRNLSREQIEAYFPQR